LFSTENKAFYAFRENQGIAGTFHQVAGILHQADVTLHQVAGILH
jgi:hypothetical protein